MLLVHMYANFFFKQMFVRGLKKRYLLIHLSDNSYYQERKKLTYFLRQNQSSDLLRVINTKANKFKNPYSRKIQAKAINNDSTLFLMTPSGQNLP